MNYAVVASVMITVVVIGLALLTIRNNKTITPTISRSYVESFSGAPAPDTDSRYELIFPPNNVFITSPITGISPNYTVDQFKTIFSRFVNVTQKYNDFSDIRRQREDEEMEDFPPIFILNVQFDIVIPRLDHISTFNSNRLVATMNFISAQLGLTEGIAKELSHYVDVLKKGFRYDPMTAVPIHSE